VSSPYALETAQAVLQATYGGELAAEAILDALTGALSPAGRLPATPVLPQHHRARFAQF